MTGQPKNASRESGRTGSGTGQAPADPDNNLSRGAPEDRDDRIEEMRKVNSGGESPTAARRPEDLDREDADIQREGIAGETPGIRPTGDADAVREKGH